MKDKLKERKIIDEFIELRKKVELLEKQNSIYTNVFNSIEDLIFILDIGGNFIYYFQNPQKNDLYEDPTKFIGKNVKDVFPSDVAFLMEECINEVKRDNSTKELDYYLNIKNSTKWYNAKLTPINIESQNFSGIIAVVRDICERKNNETSQKNQLHSCSERLKKLSFLYNFSHLMVESKATIDEILSSLINTISSCWRYPEITCARIIYNDKEYLTDNFKETKWKLSSDIIVSKSKIGVVEVFYHDETIFYRGEPFYEEEKSLVHALGYHLGNLVKRKKDEEIIKFLALHDPLTELPNRLLLKDRFDQIHADAMRYNSRFAVIMIDMDRLKYINDNFGHDCGDNILKQSAARLKNILRASDTIARIGGDEFVLLLPNINDYESISDKILKHFQESFNYNGYKINSTLSIGIAIWPEDGDTFDILLQNADKALYSVKKSGSNNYKRFIH